MRCEGAGFGERGEVVEEAQAPGAVGGRQLFQEQAPEQAREHAHGQEEAGPAGDPALAVGRDAAARHDAVDVRVMGQRRAPGVEHGGEADAGAEVLGVGGDGDQGLGGGLEQDVVDHRLVVIGDVGDLGRDGEHDVEVGHGQKLGLACREPRPGRRALALGAMPVAARVVGDVGVGTLLAAHDVAAERRGAAALDGRHHLELAEADVTGVGATPSRTEGAEDIRDLERRAGHGGLLGRLGLLGETFERAPDLA